VVVEQQSPAEALERRLVERTARVGVLGLGYAGLPMAVELAEVGFEVVGFDVDEARVGAVNDGRSPVSDVEDTAIRALLDRGTLTATTDFGTLASVDAVLICVPTPLSRGKQPDLRYIEAAARSIAAELHRGMLVILQSTCSPGTTRDVLLPILAEQGDTRGFTVGEEYFVVFAPERIDPGNTRYTVRNTPKLVGGITPQCTALARELYRPFVDEVVPVASPEVAELAKLVENTFRFINISFINEVAQLCDRLGTSVWDVVEAASTKPFAFMPHYPGAGVGGHCIPVVPFYLEAVAQQQGMVAELIEAAGRINDRMPSFVIDKLDRLLRERGTDPVSARVLLLGVTYKRDVADLRESSALEVLRRMLEQGRRAQYHDPLIPSVEVGGQRVASVALTPATLADTDAVVLLVPHTDVAYELILGQAPLVLDTCNGLKHHQSGNVVLL